MVGKKARRDVPRAHEWMRRHPPELVALLRRCWHGTASRWDKVLLSAWVTHRVVGISVAEALRRMPAVSKAQSRYMCGVCHASIPAPRKLSKATACEYCGSTAGLPERVAAKKVKRRSARA